MIRSQQVELGVDVFFKQDLSSLKGKRIGLLTNQTGVNGELVSTIRLVHDHPDLHLVALFAPEHGILTNAKEGEKFTDTVHCSTGLPVFSLYGKSKKPTDAMMDAVDIVIFDMQDIGARYYTYMYTMAYMMQACARKGKRMIVLDRPNPIGGEAVEGNFIEEGFTSFVGLYPIPNRHGMTIGELATYFNEVFGIHCQLDVIHMKGWKRNLYFHETGLPWVPPSPNTTTVQMMLLYPGTCLLEGTNLSEGRGTTQPFEVIGAPFIDGEKLQDRVNSLGIETIRARATAFTPTYQKYAGEYCEGIQLHVTEPRRIQPLHTFVTVLAEIIDMYPKQVDFLTYGSLKHPMFDLLAGNAELRHGLLRGSLGAYLAKCQSDTAVFMDKREKYLCYR